MAAAMLRAAVERGEPFTAELAAAKALAADPAALAPLEAFAASDILDAVRRDASTRIVKEAARLWGYTMELSWLHNPQPDQDLVRVFIRPDGGPPLVEARFVGFRAEVPVGEPLGGDTVLEAVVAYMGRPPTSVTAPDPTVSRRLVRELGLTSIGPGLTYPGRI